jgi:hypothetical protein
MQTPLSDPKPSLRCDRCANYLVICGHDQPFLERIKTQRIDKASLKVKVR